VQQVEAAIVTGALAVGDRLPAERRLQEMFGISRNTLREALRALEQKGLLEIRPGQKGGAFVKALDADPMADHLAMFVASRQVKLTHMAEFRRDIEGLLARRAAERRSADHIAQLQSLVQEAEALHAEGLDAWDRFMAADRQIHLAVAEAAGNPLHSLFLQTVHENVHRHNIGRYLNRSIAYMVGCLDDLTRLVAAIVRGDGPAAQDIAQAHVARAYADMQRRAFPERDALRGEIQ
jgi:DNA-binding FadR family transcriptional regulator